MNATPQGQGTNYQINLGNEPSGVSAFLLLHPPSGSSMDIGFDMGLSEDYQAQVRVRQYLGSGSEYEEALGWTPVQMGGPQQYNIQLNQAAIAAGGKTMMELRFTKLDGGTFAQTAVAQLWSPWKYVTTYTPESRVARVCDGQENYRFGFNGMEKDNEVKGVGNSLDFGERIYDSRLGRFLSLDPDMRKYPSLAPYSFAANDPIRYIDEFGKGPGDKVVMFSGAILVPGYQKPTSTMYHILDKVSKFTGATGMYHTSYPLGLTDDNKSMIKNAVSDIKAWKAANPDGKLTIFGYSYGGVAAMDLTRALDKAGIKVDLLVTLDAADGKK